MLAERPRKVLKKIRKKKNKTEKMMRTSSVRTNYSQCFVQKEQRSLPYHADHGEFNKQQTA